MKQSLNTKPFFYQCKKVSEYKDLSTYKMSLDMTVFQNIKNYLNQKISPNMKISLNIKIPVNIKTFLNMKMSLNVKMEGELFTSNQLLGISCSLLVNRHQSLVRNHQSLVASHQLLVTDHQLLLVTTAFHRFLAKILFTSYLEQFVIQNSLDIKAIFQSTYFLMSLLQLL